jgi:hypothetical protein
MPICGLEIVLHTADAYPDLLELVRAYCEILGYKAIELKVLDESYLNPNVG